ncbi:MAG TPA: helix-hairpin-helix domain-containing protein [Chthoniobacteraceae bacterium]|nr:helix-hairpin-helix domain-containing protein [Chthoniobacteraceae bacterium]
MIHRFHAHSETGAVLIVVLVVCIGLVSLTLLLGHTTLMAYRGSDNQLAGREADQAIEGAAQYVETILENGTSPGMMPDPTTYEAQDVPVGEASFWFIGEPDPSDTSNTVTFGLVDECSKLNLNTASATMLENLPGMTQELAEAIVSWRSSSTSTSTANSTASASSVEKNAPFETVEELAQVDGGTDVETLYGNDLNLNHVMDEDETAGGATSFSPGLLEYVTVYSREPNVMSDGSKRINVTSVSGSLTQMLNNTLGSQRGAQITRTLRRGNPPKSVLEFYVKSGMSAAEFAEVSGSLTNTNAAYNVGLINVNSASATVLECVPGITESTAQQIVSTREAQSEPVTNLSWVASILGPAASAQAGPYLTAETFQVSADIAAVGHNGRGYRRTLFVIDNSSGTPQIVFRRNMAPLGWALGSQVRQTLAQQIEGKL